jgi:pyruvate,orthophosphate dikinase
MSRIPGVHVPPGFTLTTNLCDIYELYGGDLPTELWDATMQAIRRVERDMGRKYRDKEHPLLFSCRSGAAISMPGMMDNVLNISLNSETVEGLAKASGNARFAWDAFHQLLDMYGQVILGIPHEAFETHLKAIKAEANITNDVDLSVQYLQKLVQDYKKVYSEHCVVFPEDPYEQLFSCVRAVFGSWNSERAIKYQEINGITSLIGTVANI